jgi:hypothetical protein
MEHTMNAATKSAQSGESESLEQVKQRFALWREGRKRGEHISDALWAAAVGMAEQHGLRRAVQELGVDYGRLKKRVGRDAGAASAAGVGTQFVEMFAQPAVVAAPMFNCIVEMVSVRGAKMRVELKGVDGLAGLTNAFWSAR